MVSTTIFASLLVGCLAPSFGSALFYVSDIALNVGSPPPPITVTNFFLSSGFLIWDYTGLLSGIDPGGVVVRKGYI
jgi:hypothetical protein